MVKQIVETRNFFVDSEMPDELLAQVLDLYNTNPDIFNDLCDDAKANPTKYKAKEQEPLKFPEGSNTVEITNAK